MTIKYLRIAAVAVGSYAAWGHPRAASAAPAWCEGAAFSDDVNLRDLSATEPARVIEAFAHATCAPTAEATARRVDIDKSRAAWGTRLGMVEADWADVIAWVNAGAGRNVKLEFSTKELARFTPIDQYKAIVDGFERPGGEFNYQDPIYIADALDLNLSEVGRFAFIESCLRAKANVSSGAPPAAHWALCQGDIERFDLAKFHAQVRADGQHGGDIKMQLRLAAFDIKQRLTAHAAAVKAAWKLDPVYQRMFEVAAAASTEWAGGLGAQPALLELAQRMDSAVLAGSRKQYEGCEDATAAALTAAVGKIPAGTFKAMKDERYDPYGGFANTAGPILAANPEVNLAGGAYVLCRPTTGTSDFLAYFLQDTVGFRGPRTTAFSRMLTEKLTLDNVNEKIDWPRTQRPYVRRGGNLGSAGGVVAKTKVEGDLVTVTLERYLVKRNECIARHATARISRIRPSGEIEYEQVCDRMGVVTHDETWSDFQIKKRYAPLLTKGVKFSTVNGNDRAGADVLVLWPSKTTDVPSWLLGARLK